MRRTTPLTVATLLGLALLAPTTSATAAGETCRGEAATIVGTGPTLTGTEGRDVIVSGMATTVLALGGDDLICVAPQVDSYTVLTIGAGVGDDVVDTTAAPSAYNVDTDLGPGADTLDGGPGGDFVVTGDAAGSTAEVDAVRTGGGNDSVTTAGGSDVADLGPGDDQLALQGFASTPEGLLAGGDGIDTLAMSVASTSGVTFDMAAGTARNESTTAHFSSFEGLHLDAYGADIGYSGTEGADHLDVRFVGPGRSSLAADLLGGDDGIVLDNAAPGVGGSRLDAGAGRDSLVAARATGSLALDLKRDELRVDGDALRASGLEGGFLMAPRVAMVGDAQDNTLITYACRATITGGHGDDELIWDPDYIFEKYSFRCPKAATLRGGPGQDSIYGSPGDDRLFGDGDQDTIRGEAGDDRIRGGRGADRVLASAGKDDVRGGGGADRLLGGDGRDLLLGQGGRDRADGGPGHDRCVAERERRCAR